MDANKTGEYVNDRTNQQLQYILPFVRPLLVQDGKDDPVLIGSTVLLWHKGRRYMVTAAHVLRLFPEHAPAIGTDTSWVPMPGPYITTRESGVPLRPTDKYDIAFRELNEDEAKKLQDCQFLSGDRIALSEPPTATSAPPPVYLALGYPQNRLKYDRRALQTERSYFTYTNTLIAPERAAQFRLPVRSHLYINLDTKKGYGPNGFQSVPKLEGVSGGGMFRFPAGESLGEIRLPSLAGITIEHLQAERLLAATRIDVILQAIDGRSTSAAGH